MTAVSAGLALGHRDQLPSSSRYELLLKIASGGMGTVYVGRQASAFGVTRWVAIKRAHAHLLEDPEFARSLVTEAKVAARIHHPNVVAVQNVEESEGEVILVMDYVEGVSLSQLAWSGGVPSAIAIRILLDVCAGLQAAHDLTDDHGRSVGLVHRDVSPHNILVGLDGVARLTDFGIAKASSQQSTTGARTVTGILKGKVGYMAPEYVAGTNLDARSDVFSLGVVLWEILTGQRLFRGSSDIETLNLVLRQKIPSPSSVRHGLPKDLDRVVERALARPLENRFRSAAELGDELEAVARSHGLVAPPGAVAACVRRIAGEALEQRRALIRAKHGSSDAKTDEAVGRTEPTASLDVAPPPVQAPSVIVTVDSTRRWTSRRLLAGLSGAAIALMSSGLAVAVARGRSGAAATESEEMTPPATSPERPSVEVPSAVADIPSPSSTASTSATQSARIAAPLVRPRPPPARLAKPSSPEPGPTSSDRAPPNPYPKR
jgi:serine/threonine-protein kinase